MINRNGMVAIRIGWIPLFEDRYNLMHGLALLESFTQCFVTHVCRHGSKCIPRIYQVLVYKSLKILSSIGAQSIYGIMLQLHGEEESCS